MLDDVTHSTIGNNRKTVFLVKKKYKFTKKISGGRIINEYYLLIISKLLHTIQIQHNNVIKYILAHNS